MKRALVLVSFLVCAVLAACGTDGPGMTSSGGARCTPGEQVACPCVGGGEGFQVCADDGASFTECRGCADGGMQTACEPGQKACGSTCVATDSPSTGCGDTSCTPCSFPNATAACTGGKCAIDACDHNFADCDGDASNGCEVNLAIDMNHCGACGTPCSLPHASASCIGGKCIQSTCDTGWSMCNSVACDVDITSDPKNCGGCGKACPSGNGCAASSCYACDGYQNGTPTFTQTAVSTLGDVVVWRYTPAHDLSFTGTGGFNSLGWWNHVYSDDGTLTKPKSLIASDMYPQEFPVHMKAGTTYWIGVTASGNPGVTVSLGQADPNPSGYVYRAGIASPMQWGTPIWHNDVQFWLYGSCE